MPKLSDTMEEGVIAKWNVKEGDKVSSGDVIAEVETDKATMEVEVFDDGTILKILAGEGDAIPLGGVMAVIGDEGEDISDLLSGANGGAVAAPAQKENKADQKESADSSKKEEFDPILGDLNGKKGKSKAEPASAASDENETGDGRIKVSPLARKMAEDKGINLSDVKGSGPDGRIVKKDIEEFTPASKPAEKSAAVQLFESEEAEEVRISQMRKTIAKRLSESKFTNPHFYETIDIDMEPAMAARAGLNEVSDVKISFNDIIVKVASVALRRHPAVNSSWLGDVIRKHGDVNVAVAVAIDEGLMTPVLRHTDKKNWYVWD